MKETPLIFTHNIQKLQDGTKTQTRRVMSPQPEYRDLGGNHMAYVWDAPDGETVLVKRWNWEPLLSRCRYGVVGDLLWIKEAWRRQPFSRDGCVNSVTYKTSHPENKMRWKNPMFMPRWASRISLVITGVSVERIQDISPYDCVAEGIPLEAHKCGCDVCSTQSTLCPATRSSLVMAFRELWDSINAANGCGWEANPWVWAIEFKCVKGGHRGNTVSGLVRCRDFTHSSGR